MVSILAKANEEVPVVVTPDMDDQAEAINMDLVITGTADDVEVCAINDKMVSLIWNSEEDWETKKKMPR